jgi:hypothetical protein
MGLLFDLSSANIVSYLTSARSVLPRVTYEQLSGFLNRLAGGYPGDRPRVISADPDFPRMIGEASRRAEASLRDSDARSGALVEPDVVARTLESLKWTLSAYDLYILPVGAWEHRDVLDGFAREAAYLPGEGTLVLIPDFYDPDENITVMDPLPATADAVKYRTLWPGAVFAMRTGESCFVPINDAHRRLARIAELWPERGRGPASAAFLRRLAQIATAARTDPAPMVIRRLIHLSDLHLGTTRAGELQSYLQTALLREFAPANHIVITGDLFDQPRRRYFREYRKFAQQFADAVRAQTGRDSRKPRSTGVGQQHPPCGAVPPATAGPRVAAGTR